MPMIWLHFRSLLVLTLLAILFSSAACNRKETAREAGHGSHDEHEHFPAHWPETIFAASERLVALKGDRAQLSNKEGISFERELVDLFRWLPELTADSDLMEPDFDKIDKWSSTYSPLLESKLNTGGQIETMIAIDGVGEVIEELQKIVQAEAERLAANHGP